MMCAVLPLYLEDTFLVSAIQSTLELAALLVILSCDTVKKCEKGGCDLPCANLSSNPRIQPPNHRAVSFDVAAG